MTRYVDFLNHFGCDEKSGNPLLCANNSLSPTYNFLTNNFGYHTAHHCRPSAHLTQLPEIHKLLSSRIPKTQLKSYSWSCALMPWHFIFRCEDGCDALHQAFARLVSARISQLIPGLLLKVVTMRAEPLALKEQIEQSVGLLRRHL
jgi:fatty acid desaturase